MTDYNTLTEDMDSNGYGLHEVIHDGKIHRFTHPDDRTGSNNCWYVSHVTAGAYGSWKLDSSHTWSSEADKEKSREDRAILRKLIKEANRLRRKERHVLHKEAAIQAQKIWANAKPAMEHDYLRNKQVLPLGIKQQGGRLVIPMRDVDGTIWSIQYIDQHGDKLFLKNGKITGNFYLIGDPIKDETFVSEGFSTGATCFMYLSQARKKPVAIAFNAGNLKSVAMAIRKKYPRVKITIVADNDLETEKLTGTNPGLEKARAAASAVSGDLIWPDFTDEPFNSKGLSDFNDYFTRGAKL